jgi:hypothetical protein
MKPEKSLNFEDPKTMKPETLKRLKALKALKALNPKILKP